MSKHASIVSTLPCFIIKDKSNAIKNTVPVLKWYVLVEISVSTRRAHVPSVLLFPSSLADIDMDHVKAVSDFYSLCSEASFAHGLSIKRHLSTSVGLQFWWFT